MSHESNPCSVVRDLYTGDGVQFDYTITFEYDADERNNVHVALYNTDTNEYDDLTEFTAGLPEGHYYKFMNATTIRFVDEADANDPPPAPGTNETTGTVIPNIKIYRGTGLRPMDATFFPGASIRAQDLNDNFTQLRDAIEEVDCSVNEIHSELEDFYWDKTENDTVKSTGEWIISDNRIATTAAMNARFATEGGSEGVGLVWNEDDEGIWRATQFRESAGADPVNVINTQFEPFEGATNVLVLTLAGGNFAVSAVSGPWNWDAIAGNFRVVVENPATDNPITAVADLTNTVRVQAAIANYVRDDPSPDYASDTTTTQIFTTDDDSRIQSESDDATGGTASATVNFTLSDGTASTATAPLAVTWRNAGNALAAINLDERLFLSTYTTANLSVTISNLSNPADNSETELTSTIGDPAVATADTFSVNEENGSFNSVVTFDPPIHKDSGQRTIAATTTFTRPANVSTASDGDGYTVDVERTREVSTDFTFPAIWRTSNEAPANNNVVNGQTFAGGWNNTGVEGTALTIDVPAVTGGIPLWAGFRTAGGVPGTVAIFNPALERFVDLLPEQITQTVVNLSPTGAGMPPAGYTAESYTFLSFFFNSTVDTQVRYS